jgi:molybdate transport system ATP-binding protein
LPYLQRLAQEIHIPMLYVSHSLDEIQHLADRVLVLEAGKVKAFGPLEEVWSSSVMHPWLPAEQQSTILSATVAAQHPQYAMTALALGDQHAVGQPARTSRRRNRADPHSGVGRFAGAGPAVRHQHPQYLARRGGQCLEVNGQIEVQLRVSGRRCGRASARGRGMTWR